MRKKIKDNQHLKKNNCNTFLWNFWKKFFFKANILIFSEISLINAFYIHPKCILRLEMYFFGPWSTFSNIYLAFEEQNKSLDMLFIIHLAYILYIFWHENLFSACFGKQSICGF